MADQKRDPAAQYGYGPPDNTFKGYGFYDDPSPMQKVLTIGLDLFLVFAVAFTVVTGGKRLAAFVNQKFTHRKSRQAKRSASRVQTRSDVGMEAASPPTGTAATTTHDAPRS